MDESLKEQLVAAVLLAFNRVELSPQEQVELSEAVLHQSRIRAEVDESALMQIAFGMDVN